MGERRQAAPARLVQLAPALFLTPHQHRAGAPPGPSAERAARVDGPDGVYRAWLAGGQDVRHERRPGTVLELGGQGGGHREDATTSSGSSSRINSRVTAEALTAAW